MCAFPTRCLRLPKGADAVINLVGILCPSGKQTFNAVQDEGARHVAEAARAAGAQHVRAYVGDRRRRQIAFDLRPQQGRGRGGGKRGVPDAVILRPSVVFGPEDEFFNRFAALARISPALPLIGGGKTKFQPVFAGDVAKAVIAGLTGKAKAGAPYELGGPEVLTMREVMQRVLAYTMRKRLFVPLPFLLAKLQGAVLQLLPNPPLTLDQVRLLESDNVVSEAAKRDGRTLEGLGIEPVAVEAVVPDYLEQYRPKGQFSIPPTGLLRGRRRCTLAAWPGPQFPSEPGKCAP